MSEFRSGFVSLVGRPNVGKSTLVNALVGQKVSITSPRPQTTRTQIRGVRTTPSSQIVLLDTPGIHKPRTLLGERCNERSVQTLSEVDVVCLLIEASAPIGAGDRFVARLVHQARTPRVLVVNKVDVASRAQIVQHLTAVAGELGEFDAYLPLSARTGEGVDALAAELEARMPEGPVYYPDGAVSDQPEVVLVAELLREKLLAGARDELPHSIMVTAEELEPPIEGGLDGGGRRNRPEEEAVLRYRVVVTVERDSQKGIVIGRGGAVIRDAGTAARRELEALLGARVYLETRVKVDKDWQRRPHALDRLGL
ncbi:MAG: GTPase Era [Actinobacteria bacterium]|nr:GTPase Era [Actinomycetota bacterium]